MSKNILAAGLAAVLVIASAVVLVINAEEDWPGHDGLEIYGNANGDWSIDEDDIAHIQAIIDGEEEPNKFADANRDGKIDEKDIEHVQALIDGEAEFIWILDGNGDPVKVKLPVERIGVEYLSNAELMNVLNVSHKVVAADAAAYKMKDFYFPGQNIYNIGQMHQNPNYEDIIENTDMDVLFTFSPSDNDVKNENLGATDVVFLGLYWPNVMEPEDSRFMQGVMKAGYILDAVDRANDYKEWLEGLVDDLHSVTSMIEPEDRPDVLMTTHRDYWAPGGQDNKEVRTFTKIDPLSQACMLAGGNPIAMNIVDNWIGKDSIYFAQVGLEYVLNEEPEYIFIHTVRHTYSGITLEPAHGYDWDDPADYQERLDDILNNRSEIATLPAVIDENVFMTAGDFRNNAMGGILGAVYMAKILHPDLFTDSVLDPQAIHQEFVSDWMGLDYDLSQNGVFITPVV